MKKKIKIEKIIFVRELKKRLFEETFFEIEIFGPRFSIFRNPYCPSLKVSSLKKLCEPSSIGGGTPGSLDCQLQHTRVVARRITLRNRTALARGLCASRFGIHSDWDSRAARYAGPLAALCPEAILAP